jgi:flagellar basal-body rod protein FlgF
MDRMIYTSMSGAKSTMQRQDSLANNLANVSTNGFRAELQAFRSVPLRGDGASTRVFSLETTSGHDDKAGPIQNTGRDLDVAMKGNAWMAVQALDGTEAYTRNGALDVDSEGNVVTPDGLQVLGDSGPINVPINSQVTISGDGTVNATIAGSLPTAVGKLKLVTPDKTMDRGDDGLFRAADRKPLDSDATAQVQGGALEGSNVSSVQTMVDMIAAARQFEAQMKMMTTAESDEKAASQLLSTN